ncbi:MAG: SMP-30/gluconolactonase/LRE family protein [Amnibacterium sp.]
MPSISTRAVPATGPEHVLAESPVWDERTARLYWVDIPAGAVIEGRLTGDEVREERRWHRPETVSAVCPAADGTLLVAGANALHRLHPEQGWLESGPALIEGPRRLNDGAADPAGRYVVGSLATSGSGGDEVLLQTGDAPARPLRSGIGLSNGIDWSRDGTTLYHVDSTRHTVSTAAYDPATGTATGWATLFEVPDGVPDGLALDADGLLWVACWGVGQVRRYDHDGRIRQVVEVDAPLTSSFAFAGDGLGTLVITTARDGLSAAELAAAPASGSLFVARPGVAGRLRTRWAGGLLTRAAGDPTP